MPKSASSEGAPAATAGDGRSCRSAVERLGRIRTSNSQIRSSGLRHSLRGDLVRFMFSFRRCRTASKRAVMADQIVITEKSSQAKDVRAAVGSRYGDILPAEGHLFDLLEPEDVVPAWKRWSPILLRPECLCGTRPAHGGNKAAKLKAIHDALRTAKRVWLATDCDREGQLIGQEILEHYEYRGQVMRVLFTAQDSQTIRDAFGRAKPNTEYARLYAAAVARRQADQIYNLSTHSHRDRHSWAGFAPRDRRWSREDADLGHRLQARSPTAADAVEDKVQEALAICGDDAIAALVGLH
jgi:Toprim domain